MYAAADEELVCPPAKSFFCISQLGTLDDPETITFHAKEMQNFSVSLRVV